MFIFFYIAVDEHEDDEEDKRAPLLATLSLLAGVHVEVGHRNGGFTSLVSYSL